MLKLNGNSTQSRFGIEMNKTSVFAGNISGFF